MVNKRVNKRVNTRVTTKSWKVIPSSLKLSVSAIIDDAEIVSADLQRAHNGDMKKLTITLIPQIHIKHAHLLCSLMHEKGEFPPLLKLSVSAIIDDSEIIDVDLQKNQCWKYEKDWQLHWFPKYTMSMLTFFAALRTRKVSSPSLKLSVSAIIDDSEIVGVDSWMANVGDMKKWQLHWSPKYTISMLTFFAPLSTRKANSPLFGVICLCHYWWCWDWRYGFTKS